MAVLNNIRRAYEDELRKQFAPDDDVSTVGLAEELGSNTSPKEEY